MCTDSRTNTRVIAPDLAIMYSTYSTEKSIQYAVFVTWVPRQRTPDSKKRRVDLLETLLRRDEAEGVDFLQRIVWHRH